MRECDQVALLQWIEYLACKAAAQNETEFEAAFKGFYDYFADNDAAVYPHHPIDVERPQTTPRLCPKCFDKRNTRPHLPDCPNRIPPGDVTK